MLTKILKKLFLTTVALSMFVTSMVTWRYQGDIHHMYPKIFESTKSYPEDVYNVLWAMHNQDMVTPTIEMREITFAELPSKLWNQSYSHPSEVIIANMIDDPKWEKFVPNSKSSTYKTFQTFWISQHISIKEVMDYRLKGIEEEALAYFGKSVEKLDIYEIVTLLNVRMNGSDGLLDRLNDSITLLKQVFPEKYKMLNIQKILPKSLDKNNYSKPHPTD
ncbi:MAG: hypothetical protein K0U38_05920 [Epsilonproteobacteria bacterium]|nr:hypothetical protein [Campylobacterota bacterium]